MVRIAALLMLVSLAGAAAGQSQEDSVFFPANLSEQAKTNAARHDWVAAAARRVTAAAKPWLDMSDDQLWALVVGPTITRSWMVWSNGHCPACAKSVPMYNWRTKPLEKPWKVQCPHCNEWFQKNDFAAFYRSGLGADGVFDPKRADRGLLFNAEHPGQDDPKRQFGVDDGEGYGADGKRWRFIGAYLVYGQWKQLVLGGVMNLSAAYVVTGEKAYAHKAAVLLDRVADLYPNFDYAKQGLVYETGGHQGYVSVWHDACEETRQLVLAYDAIKEGIRQDQALVEFLAAKAKRHGLANAKQSIQDIRRNIEEGILRDALKNKTRIESNYPRTDVTVAVITSVLEGQAGREKTQRILDGIVRRSTAVDGTTGEKGLASYAASGVRALADLLALYTRADPEYLADLLKRHPALRQTWRFHIDTWFERMYYPNVGDSGFFAMRQQDYRGLDLRPPAGAASPDGWVSPLQPSMHSFLWQLARLTGEGDYLRLLYLANGSSVAALPHDIFAEDPAAIQQAVKQVVDKEGSQIRSFSVDKAQWRLGMLRSGEGGHARAAWLAYDVGGRHGHADGMNLGLFAKGLDLMPDFGYPPVNYGGWGSPQATWYTTSAAHNTVVVDGRDHAGSSPGHMRLWCVGDLFQAMRVSGAGMIKGKQFERTIVLANLSPDDFYLLDIFRVNGGADHVKFMHSYFGKIATQGLSLKPAACPVSGGLMRNFRSDTAPRPGWTADWTIEDRYRYLKPDSDVHLRYTDLTANCQAYTCEGWVLAGGYEGNDEVWIPRVLVRRQAKEGALSSAFVGLIEPYEAKPSIQAARRLRLTTPKGEEFPDAYVAVEVQLADGGRDLFIAADVENPLGRTPAVGGGEAMVQSDWRVRFDGELLAIRVSGEGKTERLAVSGGTVAEVGEVVVRLADPAGFAEVTVGKDGAVLAAGRPEHLADVLRQGKSILRRRPASAPTTRPWQ